MIQQWDDEDAVRDKLDRQAKQAALDPVCVAYWKGQGAPASDLSTHLRPALLRGDAALPIKSLSVLRNSASRDAQPIRRRNSHSHGALHQTKRESHLSPAACSCCGELGCEREPFSLALRSGCEKHISSYSWTSSISALQKMSCCKMKLYALNASRQDERSSNG